jgi:hypothetical protein
MLECGDCETGAILINMLNEFGEFSFFSYFCSIRTDYVPEEKLIK